MFDEEMKRDEEIDGYSVYAEFRPNRKRLRIREREINSCKMTKTISAPENIDENRDMFQVNRVESEQENCSEEAFDSQDLNTVRWSQRRNYIFDQVDDNKRKEKTRELNKKMYDNFEFEKRCTTKRTFFNHYNSFDYEFEPKAFQIQDLEILMAKELYSLKANNFFETQYYVNSQKDVKSWHQVQSFAKKFLDENPFDKMNLEMQEKAFENFTKSIACAPVNSENLAVAYSERAELLHLMNKIQDCNDDLERALAIDSISENCKAMLILKKIDYSVFNVHELARRNYMKYIEYLTLYDDAKCLMQKIKTTLDSDLISLLNKVKKKLEISTIDNASLVVTQSVTTKIYEHEKLYQEKKMEDTFLNKLAFKYDDFEKPHVYANQDFMPGEIILVDDFKMAWFDFNYGYLNCNYCYKKSWSCIPCDHCNWCMFCSEDCKNAAWNEFHDIECKIVSIAKIACNTFNYYDFLTFRCLLQGIKSFYDFENFKSHVDDLDNYAKNLEGFPENNDVFFSHIYSLNVEVQKMDFVPFTNNCGKILILLAKEHQFFGKKIALNCAKDMIKNEDILFLGRVYLILRRKIVASSQVLHKLDSKCNNVMSEASNCMRKNKCKGACVSPTIQTIKHSCYPNTKIFLTNEMSIVFIALRPIPVGSELLVSFEHNFIQKEKYKRQMMIKKHLRLDCKCEACLNEWPTLYEMYRMPIENTELFLKKYNNPRQIELFKQYTPVVQSLLKGKTKVSQKTINKLNSAMLDVISGDDEPPSVIFCELIICLSKVLDTLYNVVD